MIDGEGAKDANQPKHSTKKKKKKRKRAHQQQQEPHPKEEEASQVWVWFLTGYMEIGGRGLAQH